jgi:hypothetical protein
MIIKTKVLFPEKIPKFQNELCLLYFQFLMFLELFPRRVYYIVDFDLFPYLCVESIYEYIYYWILQFLNIVMIIKTKVLFPRAWCFYAQNLLIYLNFKYFDIERTWWRLFLKCVISTKLDVFL